MTRLQPGAPLGSGTLGCLLEAGTSDIYILTAGYIIEGKVGYSEEKIRTAQPPSLRDVPEAGGLISLGAFRR